MIDYQTPLAETMTPEQIDRRLRELTDLARVSPPSALDGIGELLRQLPQERAFLRARAHAVAMEAYDYLGRREGVDSSMAAIAGLLQQIEVPSERKAVLYWTAIYHYSSAQFAESYRIVQDALETYPECEDRMLMSSIYNLLGLLLTHAGQFERALDALNRSYEFGEGVVPLRSVAMNRAAIAKVYRGLFDFDKVREYLNQALRICDRSNDRVIEAIVMADLGDVEDFAGNYPEAIVNLERAVSAWRKLGGGTHYALATAHLAEVYEKSGDVSRALATLGDAVAIAESGANRDCLVNLTIRQAVMQERNGLPDEARRRLESLLDHSPISDSPMIEQGMRETLGRLYATVGEYQAAYEHLLQCHSIFVDMVGAERRREVADLELRHAIEIDRREREALRLRAENAELESESHVRELNAATLGLIHRNEALKALHDIVLPHSRNGRGVVRKLAIDVLEGINRAVGSHDEWRLFNEQFERVHAHFIARLRETSSTLTPTEIRICILIRLNLSTKQIADLLFAAVVTIKTHRQNIRRKLDIDADDNLTSFLMSL